MAPIGNHSRIGKKMPMFCGNPISMLLDIRWMGMSLYFEKRQKQTFRVTRNETLPHVCAVLVPWLGPGGDLI